jgi:hypothetical protein
MPDPHPRFLAAPVSQRVHRFGESFCRRDSKAVVARLKGSNERLHGRGITEVAELLSRRAAGQLIEVGQEIDQRLEVAALTRFHRVRHRHRGSVRCAARAAARVCCLRERPHA